MYPETRLTPDLDFENHDPMICDGNKQIWALTRSIDIMTCFVRGPTIEEINLFTVSRVGSSRLKQG